MQHLLFIFQSAIFHTITVQWKPSRLYLKVFIVNKVYDDVIEFVAIL